MKSGSREGGMKAIYLLYCTEDSSQTRRRRDLAIKTFLSFRWWRAINWSFIIISNQLTQCNLKISITDTSNWKGTFASLCCKMYLFWMRQFKESTFSQHKLIHFHITSGWRPRVIWNESMSAEKKLIPRIASSRKGIL